MVKLAVCVAFVGLIIMFAGLILTIADVLIATADPEIHALPGAEDFMDPWILDRPGAYWERVPP